MRKYGYVWDSVILVNLQVSYKIKLFSMCGFEVNCLKQE